MNRSQLRGMFGDEDIVCSPLLSLSRNLDRIASRRTMLVGGDQKPKTQIDAVLDALHWAHWDLPGDDPVTLVLGSGPKLHSVKETIALLMSGLRDRNLINFQIDLDPPDLSLPDIDRRSNVRLKDFRKRDQAVLPEIGQLISQKISDPSFQWEKSLTQSVWSGRIDGLQVCLIDRNNRACLTVGKPGSNGAVSTARSRFHSIIGMYDFPINDANMDAAVFWLQKLIQDRRSNEPGSLGATDLEHKLEARVRRGAVQIVVPNKDTALIPLQTQFPTFWSSTGRARYIDVLMYRGNVPIVLELKVPEGAGQWQYFREAVGQVALYREFIRRATGLYQWFAERNLDATQCRAAVAFPMMGSPKQRKAALEHVQYLADLFDVDVIVLPDDWNAPDL